MAPAGRRGLARRYRGWVVGGGLRHPARLRRRDDRVERFGLRGAAAGGADRFVLGGLAIGTTFGFVRALPLLTVRGVRDDEALAAPASPGQRDRAAWSRVPPRRCSQLAGARADGRGDRGGVILRREPGRCGHETRSSGTGRRHTRAAGTRASIAGPPSTPGRSRRPILHCGRLPAARTCAATTAVARSRSWARNHVFLVAHRVRRRPRPPRRSSTASVQPRITSGEFGPDRLQRALPGQAGAQFFFTERGRRVLPLRRHRQLRRPGDARAPGQRDLPDHGGDLMPTRRQARGAAAHAGSRRCGGPPVLSSCTPPPVRPSLPSAHAYLLSHPQRLPARSGALRPDRPQLIDIVQGVYGRPAWFPDGSASASPRGTADDSQGTWALWLCRVGRHVAAPHHQPAPAASPIWIRTSPRTGRPSPSAATPSASAPVRASGSCRPPGTACIRCRAAPAASRRASAST